MAFQKGLSGNPQGRPKGISDRRAVYRELMEEHKEELFQKALKLALNGNEAMLKLLLDRLLPAKPKEEPLAEPIILEGKTFTEKGDAIFQAMLQGSLTPTQGNTLLQGLMVNARLTETDNFEQRIQTLERLSHGKKN